MHFSAYSTLILWGGTVIIGRETKLRTDKQVKLQSIICKDPFRNCWIRTNVLCHTYSVIVIECKRKQRHIYFKSIFWNQCPVVQRERERD